MPMPSIGNNKHDLPPINTIQNSNSEASYIKLESRHVKHYWTSSRSTLQGEKVNLDQSLEGSFMETLLDDSIQKLNKDKEHVHMSTEYIQSHPTEPCNITTQSDSEDEFKLDIVSYDDYDDLPEHTADELASTLLHNSLEDLNEDKVCLHTSNGYMQSNTSESWNITNKSNNLYCSDSEDDFELTLTTDNEYDSFSEHTVVDESTLESPQLHHPLHLGCDVRQLQTNCETQGNHLSAEIPQSSSKHSCVDSLPLYGTNTLFECGRRTGPYSDGVTCGYVCSSLVSGDTTPSQQNEAHIQVADHNLFPVDEKEGSQSGFTFVELLPSPLLVERGTDSPCSSNESGYCGYVSSLDLTESPTDLTHAHIKVIYSGTTHH